MASASKSELFKVWQAVKIKVPLQCLTQEAKHLFLKMELSGSHIMSDQMATSQDRRSHIFLL